MHEVISISIDKKFKKKVDRAAKCYGISKNKLVKLALEKYITHEDFRNLRKILIPFAEKTGFLTDKDIFKNIS